MITEITLVYNDLKDRQTIENLNSDKGIYINYLDYESKLSKKKARLLMEDWGSKKLPFAVCLEKDKVVVAFYSEADNVINKLKEIL